MVELKGDLRQIQSFLFAPLKDTEGEYKKSFVKKMLSRSLNENSVRRFTNKEQFLKHVRRSK